MSVCDPLRTFAPLEHDPMSKLYPARRIPQWMVLIGLVFIVVSVAAAVAHFAFGYPILDRDSGQPLSSGTIFMVLSLFAAVGGLLIWSGMAILKAAARHRRSQSSAR